MVLPAKLRDEVPFPKLLKARSDNIFENMLQEVILL